MTNQMLCTVDWVPIAIYVGLAVVTVGTIACFIYWMIGRKKGIY